MTNTICIYDVSGNDEFKFLTHNGPWSECEDDVNQSESDFLCQCVKPERVKVSESDPVACEMACEVCQGELLQIERQSQLRPHDFTTDVSVWSVKPKERLLRPSPISTHRAQAVHPIH